MHGITHVAFTGPRNLSMNQEAYIKAIWETQSPVKYPQSILSCHWVMGDAAGLDWIAWEYARHCNIDFTRYQVTASNPEKGLRACDFAIRSKKMIDSLPESSLLMAFPNKECPDKLTPNKPFSGSGSGTWATIAYAVSKHILVIAYPLFPTIEIPDWFFQLSLYGMTNQWEKCPKQPSI